MSDAVGEMPDLGALFSESAAIMARLRAPGGCPWDREQTPDSIRKYTLEETYEVLDAIERRDWPNLAEELGDLLLQVLFYARMAEESGYFHLREVIEGLNRKLIRRHPHVFGLAASMANGNLAEGLNSAAPDSAQVLRNWAEIKHAEKKADLSTDAAGQLSGVSRAQGALSEAAKLGSAAARVGFDWADARGLLEKVREEAAEIEAEMDGGAASEPAHRRMQEEVGDLLFTVTNLARHLKVDAELSLRDANAKFRRRFAAMEQASQQPLEASSPDELERAWAAVKAAEHSRS